LPDCEQGFLAWNNQHLVDVLRQPDTTFSVLPEQAAAAFGLGPLRISGTRILGKIDD